MSTQQNIVVAQLVLAANAAKNYILQHGRDVDMAPVIEQIEQAIKAAEGHAMRNMEDDARKLLGLKPYNTPANLVYGDHLFAVDCERRYGTKAFAAMLVVVRGEN